MSAMNTVNIIGGLYFSSPENRSAMEQMANKKAHFTLIPISKPAIKLPITLTIDNVIPAISTVL